MIAVLLLLASPVLVARLGLADAGTAPKDQTTRKAYDLLTSGFGPGFTEPIPIVVDLQSDHAAATKIETALKQVPAHQARRRADLQREDRAEGVGRDHQHQRQVRAAGLEDRRPRRAAAAHGDPADARRVDRARLRVGHERRLHRHRPPDLLARAVVPALHHRHHVPRAGDGVPLGRDRVQGRADDADVGARRVRRPHVRRPEGRQASA